MYEEYRRERKIIEKNEQEKQIELIHPVIQSYQMKQ